MGRVGFSRVTFEKGINEYYSASDLPEGYAAAITNWVPEATGALRVPRGWTTTSATGISGTKTARGFAYFVPAAGATFVVAQATSGTQYKLNQLLKANLVAGTWASIETITSSPSTRPLAMAAGAGYLLYSSPEFPSAFIRKWDGTTASDASADAIAGRALVYHNNRFFTGGATTNSTYLRWCELGDPATWETSTNFQPIGQDDGEPIEDLAPWDRNLIIGKANSIWYQTGFGPDTFSWHKLDGGGCAPGRTLIPYPNGICAIGRERVWNFTGGGFEPISQPIETSYGMSGNYMSGTYVDGVVYVCDEGSGSVWAYDLATQAWHKEMYDSAVEGPGLLWSNSNYMFGGVRVGSTNPLSLYRLMPGSSRARNTGSAMTFTATSREFSPQTDKPVRPTVVRNYEFVIRQRGGTSASTPISVAIYTDGTLKATRTLTLKDAVGTYRYQVSAGFTGYRHQIIISQVVGSAEACVCDIEEAWAEYQGEEPR